MTAPNTAELAAGERAHTMADFTPGPWSVKHTDTTYYVESAEGIRIVSTSWHDRLRKPYPLKPEAFANATVAAAAPDMFEALKACHKFLCKQAPNNDALLDVIDAALAKASPSAPGEIAP